MNIRDSPSRAVELMVHAHKPMAISNASKRNGPCVKAFESTKLIELGG